MRVQQHPQNILSAHFGRYRDFGLYTDSLALYGKRMFYYVWDVPIFCLMGAVGGLMGALWVHVNVRVTAFRHRTIPVRCEVDGQLIVISPPVANCTWFCLHHICHWSSVIGHLSGGNACGVEGGALAALKHADHIAQPCNIPSGCRRVLAVMQSGTISSCMRSP